MQSRPKFEGDTALNLREAVLPEIEHAVAVLEDFLNYEHASLVARNLSGGLRELITKPEHPSGWLPSLLSSWRAISENAFAIWTLTVCCLAPASAAVGGVLPRALAYCFNSSSARIRMS